MMLAIDNVLAPVDFSPATEHELGLALEICQLFDARLVLHHNNNRAPLGFSRAWDWSEVHHLEQRSSGERRLRKLLASLPEGLAVEARISYGQVVPSLQHLARLLPADLMILASHGCSTADHASVAERMIADPPCPVLTLHECEEAPRPLFQGRNRTVALVPVDFSPAAERAQAHAFSLARKVPMRLHLLHVVPGGDELAGPVLGNAPVPAAATGAELDVAERLGQQVPADLSSEVEVHVVRGRVCEAILAAARELDATLIVMGEHSRSLLQRWLTADHALGLLHRAPCPVLYVPERASEH